MAPYAQLLKRRLKSIFSKENVFKPLFFKGSLMTAYNTQNEMFLKATISLNLFNYQQYKKIKVSEFVFNNRLKEKQSKHFLVV